MKHSRYPEPRMRSFLYALCFTMIFSIFFGLFGLIILCLTEVFGKNDGWGIIGLFICASCLAILIYGVRRS